MLTTARDLMSITDTVSAYVLVMYAIRPSRSIATPCAPDPVTTVLASLNVCRSIMLTVLPGLLRLPCFATRRVCESGVAESWIGTVPTLTLCVTFRVAGSIAATAFSSDSETNASNPSGVKPTWAGSLPTGTRQKLSMIATVTNQGKTRWMIIGEAFDAEKLIEFLQALIKDAGKKVFLILDNLRVHHSKLVKAWEGEHKDELELFYLPSYSPQLNPEERLNADL